MSKSLKKPAYGNCVVYSMDNEHLFNCSFKKTQWYLTRNLAVIIQEEPFIIRLNFECNGPGNTGDAFMLQCRQNICVVCGNSEKLSKHHICPIMYRRWFPIELKSRSAYDVLPVCLACHDKYEVEANKLKHIIAAEFGVVKVRSEIDRTKKKVCSAASGLLFHGFEMPEERYEELADIIREYYGREISDEDIEEAAVLDYQFRDPECKSEGQVVVEKIIDYDGFVRRWREHFIAHTKAQYLPEYYDVNRPLDKMNSRHI